MLFIGCTEKSVALFFCLITDTNLFMAGQRVRLVLLSYLTFILWFILDESKMITFWFNEHCLT
jgi:hypothetical protein